MADDVYDPQHHADQAALWIEVYLLDATYADVEKVPIPKGWLVAVLADRQRLQDELNAYIQAESADAAAGSYAGRAETAEAEVRRLQTRNSEARALAAGWRKYTLQQRAAVVHGPTSYATTHVTNGG